MADPANAILRAFYARTAAVCDEMAEHELEHIVGQRLTAALPERPAGAVHLRGEGVVFNYSLFDTLPLIRAACATTVIAPTRGSRVMHAFPFGVAPSIVVCGLKDKKDMEQ